MKFKTTASLAAIVSLLAASVYVFEFRKQNEDIAKNELNVKIVTFQKDQINFLEIQNAQNKIVLQKDQNGWTILEPVQDSADNDQVENLLEILSTEKVLTVAKTATTVEGLDLAEFGLKPAYANITFKNNLGSSLKISLGSQKNFEGNAFLHIDSQNKILVASPTWLTKVDQELMTYREKRLYRSALGAVKAVQINSLHDKFQLERVDNKWIAPQFLNIKLDQNKVINLLKQIAESTIQDYIFDGEPSAKMIADKKLVRAPVEVRFTAANSSWSVAINQHQEDNAVYALTERPTNLLKIDPSRWELFGNLNLDSLRDRSSPFQFRITDVAKIHFKDEKKEFNFIKTDDTWRIEKAEPALPAGSEFVSLELIKLLNRIHDLEVSEFLDGKINKQPQSLAAKNMLFLKSSSDNLILQLNWGPELKLNKNGEVKDYFYARTNIGENIFALRKDEITAIDPDNTFINKDKK